MAMENPDCPEKHPPLKSEHEELNESALQKLIEFIRNRVGHKFAEGGFRYKAPDDDEHNYWPYIVEGILDKDKNDVAVCVQPCNVDEPDTETVKQNVSPPQEDANERANRQAEELLREEEARIASQQKISSSKTLKNKKKKAKQKAKQGKDTKPDEVDEDKVGKGDKDEEDEVNEEEKDEGYEGKKVNVAEEERTVGYEGERDGGYDAGRVNNKKEEKVKVDEEKRAIGYKVEEVHVEKEKRAVGYEEEKAVGFEEERAVRYGEEKVNVDEKKRAHRYEEEKAVQHEEERAVRYEEEKVNVEEKRANGSGGEKGNGYEGEKDEGKRTNGYEGEKGNGYEGEKGEGKRANWYDGEKGEGKRANGYGREKGNGYGEKGKEERAHRHQEGRVVADSRLQNVVPATVGKENMETDNTSRTRLKFDETHVSNLSNFQEEAGDDTYMLLYKKAGGEQYKEKKSCSVNGRQKDSNEEKESSLSEFTADERDKDLSQNRAEENGQVAFNGIGRDMYSNNNRMPRENVDGFQDTETAKQTEEVRQSEENTVSEENVNIAQHEETIEQTEALTQTMEGIFSNENVSEAQDTETVRQIEEPEQAPGKIIWTVKVPEALETESVKQTQEPKRARNVDEVQDKKRVKKSNRLKQPRASANTGPVGIRNLGSNCYMNAVFQFLLRPMGEKWLYLDKQEAAATDTDTDLIKDFHQLWELLLSNNGGFTIEPESTERIQSAWNQFKHPNSPSFEPTQQEDAEEFMEFIFTHLLNGRLCINAFQGIWKRRV
ncbi:hypothetical protein SUGI_0012500 [Cryptomeria japonica]|nr:hypothetical protein SUGI_0012500 [Cryptomeria japonica]